jgi:serine/threonine protein kinase
MEELGTALGRFVGGLSDVDELRGVFKDYLRRHPGERDAVSRWLGESIQIGRVSPAVMLTIRDLLSSHITDASIAATVAAARAAQAVPRPRPPVELSRGPGPTSGASGQMRRLADTTQPPDADGPLHEGSVLDNRYTIIEELGHGGMGTVYKARDRNREDFQDRRPFIALKVLSEEFKRHPDARMALQRETVRAQNLAHPNIITVFDFDYDGPHAYMTMELLEGQTLDNLLQSEAFNRMPFERRWQIVCSIGAGLAYAHEKGVVHSDLKPGNVFLCKNGAVKVMDFGIARPLRVVADQSETTAFDPAERLGGLTPAYASLEQWNHDPPDPRDDMYAFACVVYILFSGKHPFARQSAKTAFETRLVPQRIDGLTRRQWDALKRGLSLQRGDRLGSVNEFLKLFTPQTRLQKYRMSIAGISTMILSALLFFGARSYREYVTDQAMNAQLWPPVVTPVKPLTPDQQHEVDDLLYLGKMVLAQATKAQSVDEMTAVLSSAPNNLHDLLTSVREMDPSNAQALEMTSSAAGTYAGFARTQLEANKLKDAYKLAAEGQKFEHTRELLRIRQEVCHRSAAVCAGG